MTPTARRLSILLCAALAPAAPLAHGDEAAAAPAIGAPGDPAKVTRTIEVRMDDTMRFHPDRIAVKPGETVRFLVHNDGKLRHEMMIGTEHALQEHAAMMRAMPDMQHHEPNIVSLAPGQRGRLVWRFGAGGTVPFACMQPGHLEAGMKGEVDVR